MTAKNIRKKSALNDQYFTPPWAIDQCIQLVLPKVLDVLQPQILDAGCGSGAFGQRIKAETPQAIVHGFDLDPKLVKLAAPHYDLCLPFDFLFQKDATKDAHAWRNQLHNQNLRKKLRGQFTGRQSGPYDLSLGNPPFTFAAEFIDRELELADVVVKILRHGFMGSEKRAAWWAEHKPFGVWNIAHRVSFTPDGLADSSDYVWIAWKKNYQGATILEWLPTVPEEERKAHLRAA